MNWISQILALEVFASLAMACLDVGVIQKSMTDASIVSDIIDGIGSLEVAMTFPSGASVCSGNQLTTKQVKDKPTVHWLAEPDAFYTLVLSDPDAPSRYLPFMREVFHWVVVNVKDGDASTGDTIADFMPSGPLPLTGLHRYVVMVFRQPNGRINPIDEEFIQSGNIWSRLGRSTRHFAAKYDLGTPLGGNFYVTKYGNDDGRCDIV